MMRVVRRNTELGLVLLAALVITGLYVLAALGRTAKIPANIGPFLAVIIGLLVVAHLAVRKLAPDADGMLLPVALLLNGIGYVFIARLNSDLAGLQATWTALGVGVFVLTLLVVRRARDLERLRYTVALVGLLLLILPAMPGIGRTINGARLWVSLGPVNFQPGEFAKIALTVFFASYLVEKRELLSIASRQVGPIAMPDIKHFGPLLLAFGAALFVIFVEKDLGSALLFYALFIVLLWVVTGRGAYLGIGGILFAAGATFAWATQAHVQERVRIWLDPWPYAAGQGYQLIQGLYAMAAGGIAGTGVSLGSPTRIPAAATDFIFAAIGEELGLLGTAALLIGFVLLIGTGLRIAMRADHRFDKVLATGLTAILGIQTFIIVGGVVRAVPLTGITLPFVSYGGSSLLANYILLALLLRISDDTAKRTEPAPAVDETRAVPA